MVFSTSTPKAQRNASLVDLENSLKYCKRSLLSLSEASIKTRKSPSLNLSLNLSLNHLKRILAWAKHLGGTLIRVFKSVCLT